MKFRIISQTENGKVVYKLQKKWAIFWITQVIMYREDEIKKDAKGKRIRHYTGFHGCSYDIKNGQCDFESKEKIEAAFRDAMRVVEANKQEKKRRKESFRVVQEIT